MPIRLKRVYDPPGPEDGYRVLVERLWPRGMTKERARVDEWLRDAGASPELRVWYAHDPRRWDEFRRQYGDEIRSRPEVIRRLGEILRTHPVVTFLFSARDEEHNNALALREFLTTVQQSRPVHRLRTGSGSAPS